MGKLFNHHSLVSSIVQYVRTRRIELQSALWELPELGEDIGVLAMTANMIIYETVHISGSNYVF